MGIPCGKCSSACWQQSTRSVMHYITIVAPVVLSHSIESQPKHILTSGSDSMYLGESQQFEIPSLPACSVLSVSSVNIDNMKISNMNFLWELTFVIPQLPCIISMAIAVISTFELVNSVTSDSVNFSTSTLCFCQQVFPPRAGLMFWWMPKNLITNITYDPRAAGLLNSAVWIWVNDIA